MAVLDAFFDRDAMASAESVSAMETLETPEGRDFCGGVVRI
jgi:hypothetical protein